MKDAPKTIVTGRPDVARKFCMPTRMLASTIGPAIIVDNVRCEAEVPASVMGPALGFKNLVSPVPIRRHGVGQLRQVPWLDQWSWKLDHFLTSGQALFSSEAKASLPGTVARTS